MTAPARLKLTIYQGATFRAPLVRSTVPYAVREECGVLVKACSGEPVPDSDITAEDYTGCTARAQLRRDIDSSDVITELTTDNGGITLDGNTLTLQMTAAETAALEYGSTAPAWTSCISQIEVVRPTGEVERQYEITLVLSQEGTR